MQKEKGAERNAMGVSFKPVTREMEIYISMAMRGELHLCDSLRVDNWLYRITLIVGMYRRFSPSGPSTCVGFHS